ncbi:NADPH-dependent FMN reductase, partial [Nocardia gipuzkoensis]
MANLTVLAVPGSLRAGSYNTALLREARRRSPEGVRIELYEELAALPMYNEDVDTEIPDVAVSRWREAVFAADALLIATPEHNGSIPASLKNAI